MINGVCLKNAIISGSNNIANHKSLVDDLNIFPVPDGDTGTNMSMTMSAAASELNKLNNNVNVSDVSSQAASHLLRGARGNSGVILSLLFRGFSKGLSELESANGEDLVKALGIGVDAAYEAVMKPTEGTILTVARVAYETGIKALEKDNDPIYVWSMICNGAAAALETTPELLPVLKKAGVVDAGGKGLCLIFEGMLSVFKDGKTIEIEDSELKTKTSKTSLFDDLQLEEITFTYCTEFIVGKNHEIDAKPLELRAYLETIGDCVVVVDDDDIIKVHVHTEEPGNALQEGLKFGQLLTVKVENMKEQNRLAAEANKKSSKKSKLSPAEPTDNFGFVSVAAGEGLENLFKDLGCTHIVSGGQTMNPSTDDILEAVLATPAKKVYVLPNNKNIIMAAEQTAELVEDREVIVIPTRTIPQGITAMLSFDPELSSDNNRNIMSDVCHNVSTGQVTFAARDSEYGGFKIKENEIIALDNGKLVFTEKNPIKAVAKLTKSMVHRNTSFITLIYGEDISDEQADEALRAIKSKVNSHIDVTLIKGDQPVYYFIVSIE